MQPDLSEDRFSAVRLSRLRGEATGMMLETKCNRPYIAQEVRIFAFDRLPTFKFDRWNNFAVVVSRIETSAHNSDCKIYQRQGTNLPTLG